MKVLVVTGLEFGWDCVVAVFDASVVDVNELEARFRPEYYVIHEHTIEVNLECWEG